MTSKLPVVPGTVFTEREGIHYLGLMSSQMGIIWRELGNTDLGIDGYLEVVVNGVPIGLIAVQVKSGPSYMKSESDTDFTFRAKPKHVRYWLSYRLPVVVIVYDPRSKIAYWYFIQDYSEKYNEASNLDAIPIIISKTDQFNKQSLDRLIEIASIPDSKAHAMLALRASRYKVRQELLTSIEMIELYEKRNWLEKWFPLDESRKELLLHSSLGEKGPAWYWFRNCSTDCVLPYLRSALKHPEYTVKREAILALGGIGKEAVKDLKELLRNSENVVDTAKALTFINDFTEKDREQIIARLWQLLNNSENNWTGETALKMLTSIAILGGRQQRETVIERYTQLFEYIRSSGCVPPLLKTAGALWGKDEIMDLRQMTKSPNNIDRALAMVALAQVGGEDDLLLIVEYITNEQWQNWEDCSWLSNEVAHLSQNETTFVDLLKDTDPRRKLCGAKGLINIGKAEQLKSFEVLLESENPSIRNIIATGLTAIGDWEIIKRLLGRVELLEAIGDGLKYVGDQQAQNVLFGWLSNESFPLRLKARKSLACIGNENILQKVITQLIKNPYREGTDIIMLDVARDLDRRLYSRRIKWGRDLERDFTSRRYSVTRDDS